MYRAPPVPAPIVVAVMWQKLVGIVRQTGAHAWVYDSGGQIRRLHVENDRIYAGGTDRVVCLHYPSGSLLWSVTSPISTDTFLADGDELFVAGGGEIAAFAKSDGRLLWHDRLKGWGQFRVAFGTPGNVAQMDDG
jgi:hypothetical protein